MLVWTLAALFRTVYIVFLSAAPGSHTLPTLCYPATIGSTVDPP